SFGYRSLDIRVSAVVSAFGSWALDIWIYKLRLSVIGIWIGIGCDILGLWIGEFPLRTYIEQIGFPL
ncbi:hypothetical protein RhiirB3_458008, partial [Rhizophagus irregularis]